MSFRYLAFHKPFNVLSQFTGGTPRPTLAAFIPVPNVYPVGRLDADSEGLLLLTDDGPFQYRLSDPKFAHTRTYWVQVEGSASNELLEPLRRGLVIQHYRTRPAEARVIEDPNWPPRNPPIRFRQSIPTSWVEIVLQEGRNRQVRKMTAAVGLPTLRLVRVAIGGFQLGDLVAGSWRDLTPGEFSQLRSSASSGKRTPSSNAGGAIRSSRS